MKSREGQAVSYRFTGRLQKVSQLIDKVVDRLGKLNAEEAVSLGWFVGEGEVQLICGRCSTNEERLWGNLSSLTDDGKWWQCGWQCWRVRGGN